jgi:hypothetical protein
MFDRLLWASSQYRRANSIPFGFMPGAFERLASASNWTDRIERVAALLPGLFPAVLIVVSLALGCAEIWRRKWTGPLALLTILAGATVLTAYPRWEVSQLIYVTPLCYAILAVWTSDRLTLKSRLLLHGCALAASFFCLAYTALKVDEFTIFQTRAGTLRHLESEAAAVEKLEKRIPPGESLFIFPYFPIMGYLLDVRNPVSYEYLQPGMMSANDEAAVLKQLEAAPPRFVLRQWLPEDQILRAWPNSDRSHLKFPSIEDFINRRYSVVDRVQAEYFDLTVLERRD